MSGGSMDYLYLRVEDVARDLCRSPNLERKAFGARLSLVAKALHDIEWVDSGDYGDDGDREAIRSALGENHASLTREAAVAEVKRILAELEGGR